MIERERKRFQSTTRFTRELSVGHDPFTFGISYGRGTTRAAKASRQEAERSHDEDGCLGPTVSPRLLREEGLALTWGRPGDACVGHNEPDPVTPLLRLSTTMALPPRTTSRSPAGAW